MRLRTARDKQRAMGFDIGIRFMAILGE